MNCMLDGKNRAKRRVPGCVVVALASVGLVVVGIPGMWVFVSLTAKPLFPNAASVPGVMRGAVAERWAGAVQRGRALMRESVAEQNLPGVSVAVGVGGELVWAEGLGFADVRSGVVVTPEHRFRLGTASMALTSAAVGRLVEEGRLGWDEEIGKHVPAFPKKQWPVTLRQLMGHTAG
ncbi:MAG: beta-lactamase family protein, partial [Acidobacteria bacterium]|nr:beta-lactamase family protein [Acidobacteriota bacterium]